MASAIKSPEGEQQFGLAAGESVTVTGMRRATGDGVVGVTRVLVARDGRLSRACGCPSW